MKAFLAGSSSPSGFNAAPVECVGDRHVLVGAAGVHRAHWGPRSAATIPAYRALVFLVLSLLLGGGMPLLSLAQDYNLSTDYENYWFSPGPPGGGFTNYFGTDAANTNASTAVYGGHVLGNTNTTLPTGGSYGLAWSSFGQPVEGIRTDLAVGDVIVPPIGTDTSRPPANFVAMAAGDNHNAYYQSSDGGAFWVPSTKQIIAAQPNNITIDWITTKGATNRQVLNVSSVPQQRPARFFWTESPYDAPGINFQGLFPVIHYNSSVTAPVYSYVTTTNGGLVTVTTNVLSGVWLDDQKQLHAKNVSGLFVLEYYQEGTYSQQVQPVGIEIVQVLAPSVQLVSTDVGSRLMPVDTYWAELDSANGVIPNVTRGLNDTVYTYTQSGPKYNWAFAIKRTWNEPWSAEVYWQHRGIMGVLWPYEVDWFSCDWPAYPQLFVIGDSATDQAPVLIPSTLSAEVEPDMDPPLHAQISTSGRSFSTTQPGYCLLKYTTHEDIWFEVVRTVGRTNYGFFDLEPQEWTIGQELCPGSEQSFALDYDGLANYVSIGESYLNRQTNWSLSLWFKTADFRSASLYSEGNPGAAFRLDLTTNGQLQVATWNKAVANHWTTVTTANAPIRSQHWHYLTLTYAGGTDTNGTLVVYLDDFTWQTNGMPRVNFDGDSFSAVGATSSSPQPTNGFFCGKIDTLRLWSTVLTADQIRDGRTSATPESSASLVADYAFDEGQGAVVHNGAGDKAGTAYGDPNWSYSQHAVTDEPAAFPGFIHVAQGDRYNVNRYNYPSESNPTASSYVFAVNSGELEVWWANRSRQTDMPEVYYPSRVARYTNVWSDCAPQIVIASGLGSRGDSLLAATNALLFTGVSGQAATVPNDSGFFNVGYALTVEAWVNLDASVSNQTIVSLASPAGSGFVLGISNRMVCPEVWNDSGTHYVVAGGNVTPGTWTHIACTFEAGNALVAYVNGDVVASVATAPGAIMQTTGPLTLGSPSSASGPTMYGALGEVRIWSVARSVAELKAARFPRLAGNEGGLVAYYPMIRGGDSALLSDAGPFGLHGTIAGATWTSPGRLVETPGPLVLGSPTIYSQNVPTLPGYNPNEEHALLLSGVAYALRNDLNATNTSMPFALVDYLDPTTGRPKMMTFSVQATNEIYDFHRNLAAGLPIEPPMPLGAMPLCSNTYSATLPPAWRDRKLGWWAISAGDDGGTADAVMHFYYTMQPTFLFPGLSSSQQPPVGSEVPWLPQPATASGTVGTPVPVVYTIAWTNVPKLYLGQTLTKAASGLPEIWGQLSAEVLYQQSSRLGQGESVDLFDPVVDNGVNLDVDVVNAMISSQLARRDSTSPLIRFPNLPPSLYPRLFYDSTRGTGGQLVLEGQYEETLTGTGYLLLNLLEEFEKAQARATANGIDNALKSKWDEAVNGLPGMISRISPNQAYVHAALGARLTSGAGYVTLAFNNSTNTQQVPEALPVSVTVIQVDTNLYSGELEVIQPGDVLAEQLSLRYSADFAGHVSECDFRWRWQEPVGGLIPNDQFETQWETYGSDPTPGTNEVTIAGASPFTLSDHYFAVQYRPRATNGPSGTNWSTWTYNLAPGWVKRVMNGVNPFLQMLPDMTANPVDTRVTMISQAGGPYEGSVALNMDAVSQAGLIPTYETVFNRAKDFSLRAGLSDPSMNETLLFAASRLRDLYMLLGNEAFADAQDPTIAFPQDLSVDTKGGLATSIFPFMNQVPNLLEEELALLRGRDDTLSPAVTTSPVYNRLIWNFTAGINGGEPAYAYNYSIQGDASNTVGTITVADAKRLYPQGHGDAWGHYLSAITHYYDLLSYAGFGWQTEPSSTLLDNATVSTDFLDEQKFAETAAARARTGAQIVKQTFRKLYSENATERWSTYLDSNTNRAWGIGEWVSRAGQAAFYDWAVANSLMLDSLTNLVQIGGADQPPSGIQKIDRASTPELREIAANYADIQTEADSADRGLNPLGLARGVVSFDIDPTAIDAGKTHFEQVYDRALQATYNACVAFDQARGATLRLRDQADSSYDLQEALSQNETDYHNRLIALYGYPYADDIGPTGTYPQGYDGPDLINWQILDLENLLVNAPTGQVMQAHVYNLVFTAGNDFEGTKYDDYIDLSSTASSSSNYVGTISVYMADNGLKVKSPTWTGRRRAQGELQLALSDYVQAWYALDAKMADYDQTLAALETEIDHRMADYSRYPDEWKEHEQDEEAKKETARVVSGLRITKELTEIVTAATKEIGYADLGIVPKETEGIVGPFPVEEIHTKLDLPLELAILGTTYAQWLIAHSFEAGIEGQQMAQEIQNADLEELLKGNEYQSLLRWNTADTMDKLKQQYVKQSELFAQVEALSQSYQRVQKLVAEGDRLVLERAQVRSRAAQRIQNARYGDISFRIYRDDALRRYHQAFDLAARYTYLAAQAYDYETGLLNSDTERTPGSQFLADVVRARLPGRFYTWLGVPMVGSTVGEPGLADVLARMKADWDVVKGRFGFNNPDTETSRFSLRTELYRIAPTNSGDSTWAQVLENCKVTNLNEVPEFVRYCRSYANLTNIEPGLVIPFSSFVIAGKNFFGNDLAGGDNTYDASHAATKVRSAGVWFTGYNNTFGTNGAGGLANQPHVYLIPVGEDIMRSPTRNAITVRHWQVIDQAIPLPYNVGGADIDNPDWLPVVDSLREPFAQIRRFASFRAYHDSGQFDSSETCTNGRLVGRSVWNTRWLLIIPGRTLLADPAEGIERFIHGALVNNQRDGNGIKDIKIFFQTYSIPGD